MSESPRGNNASIQASEPHYHDDEIDLRELFFTIWAGKWLIVSVTFIFAVVGMLYALQKPDVYQASALLVPTEGESGLRFDGQLAGLASLAGVNLGKEGSSKTIIAKEMLKSRAFLGEFTRRHELAVPLFAGSGWDKLNNVWLYDVEIYNPNTKTWGLDGDGLTLAPTDWDLVEKFMRVNLNISEKKENGMITVSVKSLSPLAAKQWADWIVHDINEHMRRQDVEEAKTRIQFLQKKLNETEIAGMQSVFYQMIEVEMRTIMLANAQQEYVFKTIDPAVVPQEKSEPNRLLVVVLAMLLGGMLGLAIVLIRASYLSSENRC